MPRGIPNRLGPDRQGVNDVPIPGSDYSIPKEVFSAEVTDVPAAPVFEMERRERVVYKQGQCPWEDWVCLDMDGVETGHKYRWVGPIGGKPKCPECGSRVALPFEAYALNKASADRAAARRRQYEDIDED